MRSVSSDLQDDEARELGVRVSALSHIDTYWPCETLEALFAPDNPSTECAMCRMFRSMRCSGSPSRRYHLLKTQQATPSLRTTDSKAIDFLSIQPTKTGDSLTPRNLGYLPSHLRPDNWLDIQSLESDAFYGRSIDPLAVDYSLLCGWLRQCHKSCQLGSFVKARDRFRKFHFYLLDCLKREVFKVPAKRQQRYVALSDVWGNVNLASRHRVDALPFQTPSRCADVIGNTITVTLQLEYRILWVDCLCVSPLPFIRHEQIANMDVV
ncbi:HET-domain-containing protein [Apiospora aurea]|uniref:HET-domain-containing protein n=1 Tax=Apiospora aurea TaxID=335848 RepID=A0ABR1QGN9_9PEZI